MGILIFSEETIHEDTKCVMDITIYIKQYKDASTISVKHLSENLWFYFKVIQIMFNYI